MNEILNKKNKYLSLDTIMVLKIGQNDSYRITMIRKNEEKNTDERFLLHNGQSEKKVIENCIKNNQELERKSIKKYMPSDYVEIYNEALNTGKYDICLTMLRGIESHINQMSNERNKLLSKKMYK